MSAGANPTDVNLSPDGDRVAGWLYDGTILAPESPAIVDLFRSLAYLCGVERLGEGNSGLTSKIGEYDHYVFVLIDGMGTNNRPFFPEGGFFESHMEGELRSIFPSTTSAALTSLASGVWPAEHGITGWYTHLPDRAITVLPLRDIERLTETNLAKHDVHIDSIIEAESYLPEFTRDATSFLLKRIARGRYARWASGGSPIKVFRNEPQAVRRVARSVRSARGRTYTYLYFTGVDHESHSHGWGRDVPVKVLRLIDKQLGWLRDALGESVRIIVTADHGHINVPEETHFLMKAGEPILSDLDCPPSGESRAPILHVKPGREDSVRGLFGEICKDAFALITPEDVEALGLYGPAPLSPAARSRLGSFVGVTRGADAMEFVPAGRESIGLIGMHGGLSADEMSVPLIIA